MSKKRLVVASGNRGKLREIAELLPDYEVIGYKDLGLDFEIVEDGTSFYENALIKAKAVYDVIKLPTLSDDSGLCVDALCGAPGIYSARYSADGTDERNNELLLKNMKGITDRSARFTCCAVYYDGVHTLSAVGVTEGYILEEEKGSGGFGYDPLFFSRDLGKCFGECAAEEKNSVSHRARALKSIKEKINNLTK